MPRQNAFLKLRKTLSARRTELRTRIVREFAGHEHFESAGASSDVADAAFERESGEMSAQLKELESRELHQIDSALARLQQGAYGNCEQCQKQIPLARLQVLPYATHCIRCERDVEANGDGALVHAADNWAQVVDPESRKGDRPINLTEMEMDVAGSRRD